MRWLGALLIVAGCGAKPPPEALENLQQRKLTPPSAPSYRQARVPRPEIDVSRYIPDFHDELRWPLSGMSHPSLEPQYPIADELANGLDWEQLCDRGLHKRVSSSQKELLSYLHGWCDVMKRDIDAACARLTPLLGTVTRGLTPAVRRDLANILAAQDADAEHFLTKHNIRDIQVLDLLAANYVEVGSLEDAFTINRRATDADAAATHETKCRRLAKRIAMGREATPMLAIEELKTLATVPKVPDPLCVRLYNKVACWRAPVSDCAGYFIDEQLDQRGLALLKAYYSWPEKADRGSWWYLADIAVAALPLEGAAELVVTAFEASLAADSNCTHDRAFEVRRAIEQMRLEPANVAYEARLQKLERICPEPALPPAVPARTMP